MPEFKPPLDLAQFLEQLRQQSERLRERLPKADALNRQLRSLQPSPYVAAELALRRAEQEWRRWRAQTEQALGPRWRDDPQWAREDQHWSKHLALLRAEIAHRRQQASKKPEQSQPQPEPKPADRPSPIQSQPQPRKAKHAGGHPPILTPDEIARLQAKYQALTAQPERRKQPVIFEKLRELLPKNKRDISDSTLRRHIVRPLRQN